MKDKNQHKILNIAVVGKPNSGKSSLINFIMNDCLCIVSIKPHSTRDPILAIYNKDDYQLVFVDTPGINDSTKCEFKSLSSKALACLQDCDCGLFLIDPTKPVPNYILNLAKNNANKLNIAVITKIDLVNKGRLLPITAELSKYFTHIFSLSVTDKYSHKVQYLMDFLIENTTDQEILFPKSMITDRPESERMKDRVREGLFSILNREIPYNLTVELDHEIKNNAHFVHITVIGMERHKPIFLSKIEYLGPEIRKNLQKQLGHNVHSFLTYKSKKNRRN
jgi:GTP-binding protein Era